MAPLGATLLVGLERSLWSVMGKSQYDWVVDQLVDGRGVIGPRGLVSDGTRAFYLSAAGVYQVGRDQALSDPDLTELFSSPDLDGSLALSGDGRYLWVLVHGRLLVCDTLTEGPRWSELDADTPSQVLSAADGAGWCGAGGLWLEGGADDKDRLADGRLRSITSTLEPWDQVPNGHGRAVCERVFLTLRGPRGGHASVTPIVNGSELTARTLSLTDSLPADDMTFWDGSVRDDQTLPVVRELSVARAGHAFSWRLETDAPFELVGHEIRMRGG